jgi:hypothetical protein
MADPCEKCSARLWYTTRLDIHFYGEDCPYICEEYERYKEEEKGTDKQKGRKEK